MRKVHSGKQFTLGGRAQSNLHRAFIQCTLLLSFYLFGIIVWVDLRSRYPKVHKDLCPLIPPGLVGNISVGFCELDWKILELIHPEVQPGGRWHPPSCRARHRVAILLPYRDREDHLKIFLHHMHPFLQKQMIEYGIYAIEQDNNSSFNRGLLLNIGFQISNTDASYNCHVFHDIDTIPANDNIFYYCPDWPRHISTGIRKYQYSLPYDDYVGAVFIIKREHYRRANGFSNAYFGWGGEDDDFLIRLRKANLPVQRYLSSIGRYQSIPHKQAKEAGDRFSYLSVAGSRVKDEGLNSVKYESLRVEKRPMYTWIYVRVDEELVRRNITRQTTLSPNISWPWPFSQDAMQGSRATQP